MKPAFIFDLDNTLFDTPTIGDELFAPVYKLIHDSGAHEKDFEKMKDDFPRIPFQKIADKYKLNEKLSSLCIRLLEELKYTKPINTFDDYVAINRLRGDRFIVTSGFTKMQESKVEQLGIRENFKEIYIIDNTTTDKYKKDLFKEIMEKHQYKPEEIVVIGDDLESEIKAGSELGSITIWCNRKNEPSSSLPTYTISSFNELPKLNSWS